MSTLRESDKSNRKFWQKHIAYMAKQGAFIKPPSCSCSILIDWLTATAKEQQKCVLFDRTMSRYGYPTTTNPTRLPLFCEHCANFPKKMNHNFDPVPKLKYRVRIIWIPVETCMTLKLANKNQTIFLLKSIILVKDCGPIYCLNVLMKTYCFRRTFILGWRQL